MCLQCHSCKHRFPFDCIHCVRKAVGRYAAEWDYFSSALWNAIELLGCIACIAILRIVKREHMLKILHIYNFNYILIRRWNRYTNVFIYPFFPRKKSNQSISVNVGRSEHSGSAYWTFVGRCNLEMKLNFAYELSHGPSAHSWMEMNGIKRSKNRPITRGNPLEVNGNKSPLKCENKEF